MIKLLVTEREKLLWRAQGLPTDTSSLVAASRVLKGPLVPILLDSSGVAVSWIKRSIGNRLEVTQPDSPKFLTTLELAVRFGKPLLVEELVEFPLILSPILRRRPLRLGDRVLPAQQGFELFLATRKDKLEDIPKEVDAVLCEITFGAGMRSLAERFVEKVHRDKYKMILNYTLHDFLFAYSQALAIYRALLSYTSYIDN